MDYKTAGVDIEAGYKSVELMKEHVKRTMREEVLEDWEDFPVPFLLLRSKKWKNRYYYQVQTDVELK